VYRACRFGKQNGVSVRVGDQERPLAARRVIDVTQDMNMVALQARSQLGKVRYLEV
jgi:hypothetical protein